MADQGVVVAAAVAVAAAEAIVAVAAAVVAVVGVPHAAWAAEASAEVASDQLAEEDNLKQVPKIREVRFSARKLGLKAISILAAQTVHSPGLAE